MSSPPKSLPAAAALTLASALAATAADRPADAPVPAGLLAPNAVVTVAARTSFLEGPAFDARGVLYTPHGQDLRVAQGLRHP